MKTEESIIYKCEKCEKALNPSWIYCPKCGRVVPKEVRTKFKEIGVKYHGKV